MSLEEYGPFGAVVTVALALIATFSLMLLKMFGGMKRWAGIAGEDAPFLISAAARLLGVAVIAATYVTISKDNYRWFMGGAIVCGLIGLILMLWFDRLRKLHVRVIPTVGENGAQTGTRTIVIGTEATMRAEDKANYDAARRKHGGLSLSIFLGGYGASGLYDPESCWNAETLADIRAKLTMLLILITLLGAIVLYLAASSIQIASRTST